MYKIGKWKDLTSAGNTKINFYYRDKRIIFKHIGLDYYFLTGAVMDIKKILLIHPTLTVYRERLSDVGSFPLGLLYIASILLKNGYDTEILDCMAEDRFNIQKIGSNLYRFGLSEKNIMNRIRDIKPDLVGISIPFSCQYDDAVKINEIVKTLDKKIITVAGGVHVSAALEMINPDLFDYCVVGEGELSLVNLTDALMNNSSAVIPSVLTKREMQNGHFSKSNHFIKDIDLLPFPRYDLLPLEKYWGRGGRWLNMVASRGCPFSCNFCSIHSVMGSELRLRSIDKIICEIELLKKRFDIQEIRFEDDGITDNVKWAKELFKRIIDKNLGITFLVRNGIRADTVDEELLILMKRAGFEEVVFAPESGSQKTLDNIIKKHLRLEKVEKAITMAKDTGLKVKCFLIIGFPQEDKEDIYRTVEYGHKLKRLGCDSFWVSCAAPYPGTRLFEECLERGITDKENLDLKKLSTLDSVIHNEYFSSEELKRIRNNAMFELNRVAGLKTILRKIIRIVKFINRIARKSIRNIRGIYQK